MTILQTQILQRIDKEINHRTEVFRNAPPNNQQKLLRSAGALHEAEHIKQILINLFNKFGTNE